MTKDVKLYQHKTNKYFIKGYLGLTGSGKTLSMVVNEVIPALEQGRKVYVNFWVNYKHKNLFFFTDWEDLHDVKNALICIDEIGDILDPYLYAEYSKADKNVIRYHRKRFNDIIFTAQDISQVAKSVRIFVHSWNLCQNGNGFLVNLFYKFVLRTPVVVVRVMELAFTDLKTLALGLGSFDLNSKLENLEEYSEDNFKEDFSDEKETKEIKLPKIKTIYYTKKHLNANTLLEYRSNNYAIFCNLCGDFIHFSKKPDLVDINIKDYKCNSHLNYSEYLDIRQAPFYSTTQEIMITPKPFVIRKYIKKQKEVLVLEN